MEGHKNLENLWVLKDCKPSTRSLFLQAGQQIEHPKGRQFIRAREKNPSIFFIMEGKVQIYNLTKCGKKKILFILGKDNIANESLVGDYNTIFCETIEKCIFFVIKRVQLLALMKDDFALTKNLFQYQERKLWRLGHQLKNTVGSIYLERKLASKLWKLARDFGVSEERGILIDMDLSVTFLADLLGVPRETASRACRRLADSGLILMEKKKIWIPDAERMSRFYKTGNPEDPD
ncbi:MAG TPA: Crp/Fnr family transcriptional regulator [Candidatus Blautia faecipullorum]|nr:Crp/Fnr family transcriptional regulator [Candidatus Blautia faecipullorum]